jgi:hypothetical protein
MLHLSLSTREDLAISVGGDKQKALQILEEINRKDIKQICPNIAF